MKLPRLSPKPSKSKGGVTDQGLIVLTVVATVALLVAIVMFMAGLNSPKPAGAGSASPIVSANVAGRLNDLLVRADDADTGRPDPDFGTAALGRSDPFKTLAPKITPPPPPEPEPEPEPLDLTPAPPPDPPAAVLTGVLKSGMRAVAIFDVQGQGATMAAVGDEVFPGGVVRSIDEREVKLTFMGREFKYLLGGDHI